MFFFFCQFSPIEIIVFNTNFLCLIEDIDLLFGFQLILELQCQKLSVKLWVALWKNYEQLVCLISNPIFFSVPNHVWALSKIYNIIYTHTHISIYIQSSHNLDQSMTKLGTSTRDVCNKSIFSNLKSRVNIFCVMKKILLRLLYWSKMVWICYE